MHPDDLLQRFRAAGALLEGHFQLSSGLHSPGYLQCALVLQDPVQAGVLGEAIAAWARDKSPAVVLSPALGGVVIGHEVARSLGVRAIFAERRDDRLTLRRGFGLSAAERILVVEDVVTTGGSTRETIAVAREAGAAVVGAATIIDRSGSQATFDAPFRALAAVSWPAHEPAACPQCALGVPVVKPGSRPGSTG